MKDEELDQQFDKKMADLYRQRQASIVPPEIVVKSTTHKNQYVTWLKSALIIAAGAGTASFAMIALMQHFAKQTPTAPLDAPNRYVAVDLAVTPDEPTESVTLVLPPNPPTEMKTPPQYNQGLHNSENPINDVQLVIPQKIDQDLELAAITLPQTSVQPSYKVLPKVERKQLNEAELGYVKFAYRVNRQGEVYDISLLDASASPALIRAAKKALAQWRYGNNVLNDTDMEIIFSFEH